MDIIERYNALLDARAVEYRDEALQARARGDERAHAIALMRASMLGDMLKALGKAQHDGRGAMQKIADAAEARAEAALARDDYDTADRERIKAQTILWAQAALRQLEAEHE